MQNKTCGLKLNEGQGREISQGENCQAAGFRGKSKQLLNCIESSNFMVEPVCSQLESVCVWCVFANLVCFKHAL